MYDLKATQMNLQYSLIRQLMVYNFKLGHNAAEANKNICCAVDHNTVTRWFHIIRLGCKYLNDQARSKSMDSKAMLQIIDTNLTSRTHRQR